MDKNDPFSGDALARMDEVSRDYILKRGKLLSKYIDRMNGLRLGPELDALEIQCQKECADLYTQYLIEMTKRSQEDAVQKNMGQGGRDAFSRGVNWRRGGTSNAGTKISGEKTMLAENIPELDRLVGKPGDAVPVVDPADLKVLWTYSQELRAKYPNGGVATGIEVFKHMCSPGADTRAVSYRCQMLGLLELMLEFAWPGGQPSEAAFKVASRMALRWMSVGVPQKGLAFDLEGFLAEVQGELMYNASGLAE
jgi:hypothetical protein